MHVVPGHARSHKPVWKVQDNHFDGHLPPFLRDWKVNVFGYLFPNDLIDDMMHSNKKKRRSGMTRKEM